MFALMPACKASIWFCLRIVGDDSCIERGSVQPKAIGASTLAVDSSFRLDFCFDMLLSCQAACVFLAGARAC